ncbi:hypothetical protein ACFQ9J_13695 [Streptomyces sp. NPDC056529]|uniref:hypothetical protein n=1 Tax=Streptomyces sp. NPDC056529 TaxID=3345855 RepID=UPI0036CBF0B6
MNAFRQYFEEHATFFGVAVPILAVVGSFAGSWAAGWMQARGGRDQAAAAREAATIAAEAQRVAALWTVRQTQVAEFVQGVREVVRLYDRFFLEPDTSDLYFQVEAANQDVSLKKAEIELIASSIVVDAAQAVLVSVVEYSSMARTGGPASYAELILLRLILSDEEEVARAAGTAQSALQEGSGFSYRDRLALLEAVRGISPRQAQRLAHAANHPGQLGEVREDAIRDLDEKLTAFVSAAREMLRSEDDVAPAAPEQRRRWRRAA